jgi:hypothetical protein
VCPEWPRWAEGKGLRLDERGALLYPNETGPYEPKSRSKDEDGEDGEDGEVNGLDHSEPEAPPEPRINLMLVAAEDLEQAELF